MAFPSLALCPKENLHGSPWESQAGFHRYYPKASHSDLGVPGHPVLREIRRDPSDPSTKIQEKSLKKRHFLCGFNMF
jgi:hypothetical protein